MVIVKLEKIIRKNKEGKLEPLEMYLDGYLKADLDFVRERVLEHNDFFLCIVDGKVGCGKTTRGIQIASYINQETKLDNICFNLRQFEAKLKSAKEGEVIVLDESFELNKRSSQSSANFRILTLLQAMREKKVFVILILPSIYDLDKTVILSLCDFFVHVWRAPFGRRGQFSAYDRQGFIKLWLFARQTYTYPKKIARWVYQGRFTKCFPIDYQAYRKKKLAALEVFHKQEEAKVGVRVYNKWRDEEIFRFYKLGQKVEVLEKLFGLTRSGIYTIIQKQKEQEETKQNGS